MDQNVTERSPLLQPAQDGLSESDEIQEYTGCQPEACCNPRRPLHRYMVLAVMCFLSFGSYFCYDNPAALQDIFIEKLGLSTSEYSALYSWYSWPNVVLSMIGGFLIDRVFGIRLGAFIFASFCLVGQVVFAAGAFFNLLGLMYFARFLFGIGGESLAVAQNTYAISWFRDHELNMVFGVLLSMSRIGSTVNMNVMQPIYKAKSLTDLTPPKHMGVVLLIASATCVFSVMCTILLAFIDRRAKRLLGQQAAATGEKIELRDITRFPLPVWLLCIICVAYYVSVFPFISLGEVFFLRRYQTSPDAADAITSLPYIVSAVASPICGFLIDRTGRNVLWIMFGTFLTLGCHICLAFTFNLNPYALMAWFGVSYSIVAASLWPLVSHCVPSRALGTAYGIMQSVQNLGLACVNLATGAIVDAKGYLMLEVFFLMWLCLALIFCSLLYLWDLKYMDGRLNRSAAERHRIEGIEKAAAEAAAARDE
ncbi:hypothetical protein BOX15_Mlig023589g1 [Macrostomum lignano]|uniref:Lysosomal dipeptide transporter MFSD1 n=2 Tax=Macrostomum lignano TaxID=282301 RepID=A0A1I8J3Z2_9PLAT|nr:hypothetical protein BOX15_Mlig011364g1 [Macrostomum lignano]PAA73700.1 hypothetical protein BOX15_Mlig023589g1 [Macrostomum lignano]